ncbi:hypothetical protein BU15DRAFT_65702 [Melanogaster broomeanus]|nr:hypothetical protein BU15DRAFT_65702 [Melanogaster broomeanus]
MAACWILPCCTVLAYHIDRSAIGGSEQTTRQEVAALFHRYDSFPHLGVQVLQGAGVDEEEGVSAVLLEALLFPHTCQILLLVVWLISVVAGSVLWSESSLCSVVYETYSEVWVDLRKFLAGREVKTTCRSGVPAGVVGSNLEPSDIIW